MSSLFYPTTLNDVENRIDILNHVEKQEDVMQNGDIRMLIRRIDENWNMNCSNSCNFRNMTKLVVLDRQESM